MKDIQFKGVDYHGIVMIKDVRAVSSMLRSQFFVIEEMVKTKAFHKEEFTVKLHELEYVIKNSRRVMKELAAIQEKLIEYHPIFRARKNLTYLKEFNLLFHRSKDSLIPII